MYKLYSQRGNKFQRRRRKANFTALREGLYIQWSSLKWRGGLGAGAVWAAGRPCFRKLVSCPVIRRHLIAISRGRKGGEARTRYCHPEVRVNVLNHCPSRVSRAESCDWNYRKCSREALIFNLRRFSQSLYAISV